jgi:hypothetical protein
VVSLTHATLTKNNAHGTSLTLLYGTTYAWDNQTGMIRISFRTERWLSTQWSIAPISACFKMFQINSLGFLGELKRWSRVIKGPDHYHRSIANQGWSHINFLNSTETAQKMAEMYLKYALNFAILLRLSNVLALNIFLSKNEWMILIITKQIPC